VIDFPASPETPLFDIRKCTIEIERQRAVLRQKIVSPEQLRGIGDHIYNRERIENSLSPMGLEEIIETRFDKLLEDVLNTDYKEYQVAHEVSGHPIIMPTFFTIPIFRIFKMFYTVRLEPNAFERRCAKRWKLTTDHIVVAWKMVTRTVFYRCSHSPCKEASSNLVGEIRGPIH
jgi:hypothetical protein